MHAFWLLHRKNYPAIAGGISFLLLILYLILFSGEPLLKPDSLGYINFSPTRSVGYPFFLKVVHFLFNSYQWVPFIQISFFCLVSCFLSVSVFQITQSFLLSTGLLIAILINIPFAKLSFSLLTDSPAQSFLMIAFALAIKILQSKKPASYYGLCCIVGIAALIRPLFIILSFLPIGLIFFQTFESTKVFFKKVGIGILIISSFLLLGSTAQWARHGFFKTEAFLGHNLIGKTLLTVSQENFPAHFFPKTQQDLLGLKPILEKAPSLQTKYLLSEPYYDEIRGRMSQETSLVSWEERDHFWKTVSISLIKINPQNYLKDVWMNYWALWQLWDLYTYKEKEYFNKYISVHSPLPIMGAYREPEMRSALNSKLGHPWIVYSIRFMLGIGFFLSLAIPFWTLSYKLKKKSIPHSLVIGTLSGLTIQSGFLAIAFTQAGLGRYALSFWPCLCILFFSAATFYRSYKHNDN